MKTNSIIIILGIIIVALLGVLIFNMQKDESMDDGKQPVACTLEAKICPDGSAVGRTGPNCEFSPCPGQY